MDGKVHGIFKKNKSRGRAEEPTQMLFDLAFFDMTSLIDIQIDIDIDLTGAPSCTGTHTSGDRPRCTRTHISIHRQGGREESAEFKTNRE